MKALMFALVLATTPLLAQQAPPAPQDPLKNPAAKQPTGRGGLDADITEQREPDRQPNPPVARPVDPNQPAQSAVPGSQPQPQPQPQPQTVEEFNRRWQQHQTPQPRLDPNVSVPGEAPRTTYQGDSPASTAPSAPQQHRTYHSSNFRTRVFSGGRFSQVLGRLRFRR